MTHRKDLTSSAVVVLFGALFLAYATRYPLDTWESPGPAVFPLIVGAALTLLGLWQLIHSLRKAKHRDHHGHPGPGFKSLLSGQGDGKALRMTVLFVVYLLAMQAIGFFVSTFLFGTLTGRLTEARGWGRHITLSLGLTFCCYLLFEVWLKLSFPRGLLF
jgi:hypothetical protein